MTKPTAVTVLGLFMLAAVACAAERNADVLTAQRPPVRTCATAVGLKLPTNWRNQFTQFGAAYVQRMDDAQLPVGPAGGGQYYAIKAMILVEPRHSVLLSVLGRGRLLYRVRAFKGLVYRLTDGASSTRFIACTGRITAFNGGLIAVSRGCVHLRVEDGRRRVEGALAVGSARRC